MLQPIPSRRLQNKGNYFKFDLGQVLKFSVSIHHHDRIPVHEKSTNVISEA